jgi:hypothetical protein
MVLSKVKGMVRRRNLGAKPKPPDLSSCSLKSLNRAAETMLMSFRRHTLHSPASDTILLLG